VGEKVRGNFGRLPGEPARATVYRFPDPAEMSRAERVADAVEQIRIYDIAAKAVSDPAITRAYEDSVANYLDSLPPDERDEVIATLDQEKVIKFKKKEE